MSIADANANNRLGIYILDLLRTRHVQTDRSFPDIETVNLGSVVHQTLMEISQHVGRGERARINDKCEVLTTLALCMGAGATPLPTKHIAAVIAYCLRGHFKRLKLQTLIRSELNSIIDLTVAQYANPLPVDAMGAQGEAAYLLVQNTLEDVPDSDHKTALLSRLRKQCRQAAWASSMIGQNAILASLEKIVTEEQTDDDDAYFCLGIDLLFRQPRGQR